MVTASDYKTVYRILKKAHVRDNFRADLKHNAAEFLKEVRPHFERGDSRLSAYDLRDLTGLTYKQVRCRVLELADAGALQKNGKNEGRQLWALTPVGRNIGLENMFSQLTPPDEVTGF